MFSSSNKTSTVQSILHVSGTESSLKQYFFHVSFDFSVSLPDVQKRTLDVAVKNSGGFLSKDKGLLGKVS